MLVSWMFHIEGPRLGLEYHSIPCDANASSQPLLNRRPVSSPSLGFAARVEFTSCKNSQLSHFSDSSNG